MADDYQVKDANGNTITMSSEDVGGGKQAPRHSIPDGKDSTQGAIADAIVAAGAAGSISAKLRRVTQALEDLKTGVILATGANTIGNVNLSATDNAVLDTIDSVLDSINAKLAGGTVIGDVNLGATDNAVLDSIVSVEGAVADAIVAAGASGSLSAKLRRVTQGLEDLKSLVVLASGDNNIGNVDIVSVPADPFGINSDAIVAAGAAGSLSAKLRRVTQALEDLKTLVVLASGNNHIGYTSQPGRWVSVTLSVTAAVHADGEVLADTQVIAACCRADDISTKLKHVVLVDKDDFGYPMALFFLNANNSLGTETDPPSITDANAEAIRGKLEIGTLDFDDLGGVKVANVDCDIPLQPASGTDDIYVGVITRYAVTPTVTDGYVLKMYFEP